MADAANIFKLLSSDTSGERREGAYLAGEAGAEEFIPALVQNISSPDIGVQEAADRALRKIKGKAVVVALIPLLRSEDAPVRNIAMDLLRKLGGNHIDAISALLGDEDPDVRIFASDILGSTKNAIVVPSLGHSLLHDPEVNVRYQAAISLGSIGSYEAVTYLNKALHDEEWVQFSVIEALTKIKDESSIAALLSALDRSSDLIASVIIDALGEMGNIKSVPLLLKRLDVSSVALGNKIIRAIVNVLGDRSLSLLGAKECARIFEYLKIAIYDEDPQIQDAAAKGLAGIGGKDASRLIVELSTTLNPDVDTERLLLLISSIVKAGYSVSLADKLTYGSEIEKRVVLEAFGHMDADAIVPLLIKNFSDQSRDIQRTMITLLSAKATTKDEDFFIDIAKTHSDGIILRGILTFLGVHGTVEKVEDIVLNMLSHPYNDVKESALEACIALGSPAVCEKLQSMCTDEDVIQRLMAVHGLSAINFAQYETVVLHALDDPEALIRKTALVCLGRSVETIDTYLPAVTKAMQDANSDVRIAAIELLGHSTSERSSELLIQCLSDEDSWVRVRCARYLGKHRSQAAVESLVANLHSADTLVVLSAIQSLGEIGGEVAFRSLLGMVEHPEPEIQAGAEDALANIRNKVGA